jgi:5-methylthioadenosine/S-adenosylhomocysteine deaminase
VEMVTGSPGDMLQRCWNKPVGRLETDSLGDLVVVRRKLDDPWANLVAAHEEQILLVLIDAQPRYGTRALMRACGRKHTTSVRIGRTHRHVELFKPADPDTPPEAWQHWTWNHALEALETVRENPTLEFVTAISATADFGGGDAASPPGLIIELDMPGALGMVAGPPPADVRVDIREIPSLRHDRNWRQDVRHGGFHDGVFNDFDRFY